MYECSFCPFHSSLWLVGGVKHKYSLLHSSRHITVCLSVCLSPGFSTKLGCITPKSNIWNGVSHSGGIWVVGKETGLLLLLWTPPSPLWTMLHSHIPPLSQTLRLSQTPAHIGSWSVAWLFLPSETQLPSWQTFFNFKKNINSKEYIFHALWPKPLQELCRWRGEGKKNRLRNETARERKLDPFHAMRSHTRLTIGHAKDAQTLAKVFLQRASEWYSSSLLYQTNYRNMQSLLSIHCMFLFMHFFVMTGEVKMGWSFGAFVHQSQQTII